MKTLLVPVDFTPTSENAVNFAAEWSRKYQYDRIILLKTFYDSMFENIMVSAEYSNVNKDLLNTERANSVAKLQQLCLCFASKAAPDVKVLTAVSELSLLRAIIEVIQNEKPDLMILGSDHYTYSSNSIIAGNLINIAKASPIRVLVVPSDYNYKPVQQALLPYNFNMLKDLNRLSSLKSSPLWSDLKLLVLNIDTTEQVVKVPEKVNEAEGNFQSLLKNFEHEIYYTTDKNVIDAVTNFTREHHVQLIIALPGKHSFLYNLTHKSISQAIYRNARQPVLILK